RIQLAVEFQTGYAVAQIDDRCPGPFLYDAARTLDVCEHQHARPLLQFLPRSASEIEVTHSRSAVAIGCFIKAFGPRRQQLLHGRRNVASLRLHPFHCWSYTECIPELERSLGKGKAPAHGAVDLHDAVGDFRHHHGAVGEPVAEKRPQELTGAIATGSQK